MNARVDKGLAGQHAVVTGGGRGIGAAIAGALAARGVHVTVMARTASAVSEMAKSLRDSFNTRAHGVVGDVANPDDVRRAFDEAVDHFGVVQMLINNAGQAQAEPFDRDLARYAGIARSP